MFEKKKGIIFGSESTGRIYTKSPNQLFSMKSILRSHDNKIMNSVHKYMHVAH